MGEVRLGHNEGFQMFPNPKEKVRERVKKLLQMEYDELLEEMQGAVGLGAKLDVAREVLHHKLQKELIDETSELVRGTRRLVDRTACLVWATWVLALVGIGGAVLSAILNYRILAN